MFSVTHVVGITKQPRNGYLPISLFSSYQYEDFNEIVDVPTAFSSITGLAVDYLTRYLIEGNKEDSFSISLAGADAIDKLNGNDTELSYAKQLLANINGLDNNSIYNTCQIVGYDAAYRRGVSAYSDVKQILPTNDVINNIRIMVKRSLAFLEECGPIVESGFTFPGGYTDYVSSGDGDYLTKDTLWDLKCSKNEFSSKWSLQILMYYIMGLHSVDPHFQKLTKLGVFNPYKNIKYEVNVRKIKEESLFLVSRDVIGYKMKHEEADYCLKKGQRIDYKKLYSTWKEINGSNINKPIEYLRANFKDTGFRPDKFKDGIHEITIDDYWSFLIRVRLQEGYSIERPMFSWAEKILFLKNGKYFMFLSKSSRGSLCILQGAKRKKAEYPPEYYQEKLKEYAEIITSLFKPYWDALNHISYELTQLIPEKKALKNTKYLEYVEECKLYGLPPLDFKTWYEEKGKQIRLSGRIHGCIVDVDYFNHLYLNPYDGTLTAYYAKSIFDADIYKNPVSLIAAQRPEMLQAFQKYIMENSSSLLVSELSETHSIVSKESEIFKGTIKEYSTDRYQISNFLRPLQRIYDYGIVQVWYDNVVEQPLMLTKKGTVDYGKMLSNHWNELLRVPKDELDKKTVLKALSPKNKKIFPYLNSKDESGKYSGGYYKEKRLFDKASKDTIDTFINNIPSRLLGDEDIFNALLNRLQYELPLYYPLELWNRKKIESFITFDQDEKGDYDIDKLWILYPREDSEQLEGITGFINGINALSSVCDDYIINKILPPALADQAYIKQYSLLNDTFKTEAVCKAMSTVLTQKNRPKWCPKEVWQCKINP